MTLLSLAAVEAASSASSGLTLLILTIVFALIFTYTNGFHDTANAIATVIGTRVLTPRQAIALAAVTNLVGSFFGLAVAKTISSGIVDSGFMNQHALICAMIAAIFWNLITWYWGLPSSSSHALIGSLIGAAMGVAAITAQTTPLKSKDGQEIGAWTAAVNYEEIKEKKVKSLIAAPPELVAALGDKMKINGSHTVMLDGKDVQAVVFCDRVKMVKEETKTVKEGILHKVIYPMIFSPLIGFSAGLIVMGLLYALISNWRPVTVTRFFGKAQLASSAYMGFSHGMNDATKCMGIITLALVTGTKAGYFIGTPDWISHWLSTPEGSSALTMGLGDRLISLLPNFLQMGYMPTPADVKSQGVPDWVVLTCALTMGAGTAAGGWKIIKTLGHQMVKLHPVHGFAAETTAATVLAVTGSLGMPVSTTHAITTSIMGVGCARRWNALNLPVVIRIMLAWIFTLPVTALIAYVLTRLFAPGAA